MTGDRLGEIEPAAILFQHGLQPPEKSEPIGGEPLLKIGQNTAVAALAAFAENIPAKLLRAGNDGSGTVGKGEKPPVSIREQGLPQQAGLGTDAVGDVGKGVWPQGGTAAVIGGNGQVELQNPILLLRN